MGPPHTAKPLRTFKLHAMIGHSQLGLLQTNIVMTHRFGGDPLEQRRYTRAPGPFEGRLIGPQAIPVLIYDLNVGGGFVHLEGGRPDDDTLCVRIALPGNGSVVLEAQTVYRHPAGVAVRFVGLDVDTERRRAHTIDALRSQPSPN